MGARKVKKPNAIVLVEARKSVYSRRSLSLAAAKNDGLPFAPLWPKLELTWNRETHTLVGTFAFNIEMISMK